MPHAQALGHCRAPSVPCRTPRCSARPHRRLQISASAAAPSVARLQKEAPAVDRLAAAVPGYAAALATQQAVLELVVGRLALQPVHSSAAPDGLYACHSHDGGAGAVVAAYRGPRVHWLSAGALANSTLGVGTTRLLGWTAADRDAPHLLLEAAYSGEMLRCTIALWPRQEWTTDLDYLHRYCSSVPAGLEARSWNDLHNAAYYVSGAHAGWRHHQAPQAEVKPLHAFSISYQFEPDPLNLEACRGWALEAAALWAAFLQAGGRKAADEQALHRLDARYFSSITSYPGNSVVVKLFGEAPTDLLLKMATGHPKVSG